MTTKTDGTLIIVQGTPIGGTLYTIDMAQKHNRNYHIFDLEKKQEIKDTADWILKNNIQKLNIAGPRASQTPNIYDTAYNVLQQIINHPSLSQNLSNKPTRSKTINN